MGNFDLERLASLRASYAPDSMSRHDLLNDKYLLATDGPYSVYYGPIGAWPAFETRIIFVGLTPGFSQLEAAAKTFLETPASLRNDEFAYSNELRKHVAFAG
jgi:hypothetical protein